MNLRIRTTHVLRLTSRALTLFAAVGAVAILLYAAVRRSAAESEAAALGSTWDPLQPRPVDVGILSAPWAVLLLPIAVLIVAPLVGRPLAPHLPRAVSAIRPSVWRRVMWLGIWTPFWLLFIIGPFGGGRDPFVAGSTVAPGPAVTEIRADGTWYDEVLGDHIAIEQSAGDRCDGPMCHGPRYIAAVHSGTVVTYLVTIRNASPFGLTILGPAGLLRLGFPRDPSHPSPNPADVVPFHPITLAGSSEVTLIVARVAGPCSDPTAQVPRHVGISTEAFGFGIVYDILGWWREASIYPPVEITIPGEKNCMTG